MTVIKRRERRPRLDKIEIGQAFARRLLLRRAARDRIDLSGVEGFHPVGPFRALDFDRPVAEAEMRDGDRTVDCRPVTVVITARIHFAALQAQDRRGILIDPNRRRRRRGQQSVMMFRQYLAQAARHFRDLGTRDRRRRKELSCEPGWQVQVHRADYPGSLVDINRRFGIERRRSRHDEMRSNAALADLAPLIRPFALLSPAQRRSVVIEPERAAGRDDPLQQLGRLRLLAIGVSARPAPRAASECRYRCRDSISARVPGQNRTDWVAHNWRRRSPPFNTRTERSETARTGICTPS